jgi:hypothetical protein
MNNIIGFIETKSDGTQVIKDSFYKIKGFYDPRTNQTKDSFYKIVGEGNLLTRLL